MDDELRSKIEEVVEEKVEKSLEENADTKFSKLVDKKIERKLREGKIEATREISSDNEMNRRSFLKILGLGSAGLGLASSGAAANLLSGTKINGNTVFHTGNDGSGSNFNADEVDGKDASQIGGGLTNMDVFRSDGTFDASNVDTAYVEVVGAGGGGSGGNFTEYGGGGGGYSAGYVDLSSTSSVSVTVGTGGDGGYEEAGNQGGNSSFGGFMSATGGEGGDEYDGLGGSGSGGDLNLDGNDASSGVYNPDGFVYRCGLGGGTFYAQNNLGYDETDSGRNGNFPGGGGNSADYGSTAGVGADGIIIVRY